MSKARPRVGTGIPYYHLRDTIEQGYGRRRILRQSCWWAVVLGAVSGLLYLWADAVGPMVSGITTIALPGAPWSVAVILSLLAGVMIFCLKVLVDLVGEQIDYTSREAELTEQCITEIERQGYDTPHTMAALKASASEAGAVAQIRGPLPLAAVGAMIAVLTVDLHVLVKTVIIGVGLLMLLYMVVVNGQANADIIIRHGLNELERRRAEVPSQSPQSPKLLPAPQTSTTKQQEQRARSITRRKG